MDLTVIAISFIVVILLYHLYQLVVALIRKKAADKQLAVMNQRLKNYIKVMKGDK